MRLLRWHVVDPRDPNPYSIHDRRDDAAEAARRIAARTGARVVIFDLGGRPLSPQAPLSRAG
jgi:Uncharacterized protein conserved in bacteria (DUF2188)